MARITQELATALPGLSKAVFSQPTDKSAAPKVELRPLILKGERVYQAERFENNKAFHQNLTEDALLRWAEEGLEGKYRQALIVTETESRQYILKRDGSYKKTGGAAVVARPAAAQGHNREKDYILREGGEHPRPRGPWGVHQEFQNRPGKVRQVQTDQPLCGAGRPGREG